MWSAPLPTLGRALRAVVLSVGVGTLTVAVIAGSVACTQRPDDISHSSTYPWHTNIVATTFWIGEVFDRQAPDGTQVRSAYDSRWMEHYGGCDGIVIRNVCRTEERHAANGFFPSAFEPQENPFYLDVPFDDVNYPHTFAMRGEVVPWAGDPPYRDSIDDPGVSLMKNRWVELRANGRTCFGQIQDAGPGVYDDVAYVFSHDDARPANRRFNGAGLDVSPALNGCLQFQDLNGQHDTVDWRFVEARDVPSGPWTRVVTTRGVH